MPSLMSFAYSNIKKGFNDFALFELNKVHRKDNGLNNEGVPNEIESTALIITSKKVQSGAAYYRARRFFDYLCENLGISVLYKEINGSNDINISIFNNSRSAQVVDVINGVVLGIVGEFKPSIVASFKLPQYSAGFEIDTSLLFNSVNKVDSTYTALSKYPGAERDICFSVDNEILYADIIGAINSILSKTEFNRESDDENLPRFS
jgi:phenylalanyl-tRNA synthetase beta subunit